MKSKINLRKLLICILLAVCMIPNFAFFALIPIFAAEDVSPVSTVVGVIDGYLVPFEVTIPADEMGVEKPEAIGKQREGERRPSRRSQTLKISPVPRSPAS